MRKDHERTEDGHSADRRCCGQQDKQDVLRDVASDGGQPVTLNDAVGDAVSVWSRSALEVFEEKWPLVVRRIDTIRVLPLECLQRLRGRAGGLEEAIVSLARPLKSRAVARECSGRKCSLL